VNEQETDFSFPLFVFSSSKLPCSVVIEKKRIMIELLFALSLFCSLCRGQTYAFTYVNFLSPTSPATCTGSSQTVQTSAQSEHFICLLLNFFDLSPNKGNQCILASQLLGAGSSGGIKIAVTGSSAVINSFAATDCSGAFLSAPPLTNGQCTRDLNKDVRLIWTTQASNGATVWSGNYQVTSTCNTGTCCCVFGAFTLTQVGTQVSGVLGLTGNCGGTTSIPAILTLATSTSTSATTTILGQTITIVKSGASVTLTNGAFPQCSGAATCTSGDCTGGGSSSTICFHESTIISYAGKTFSLDQLNRKEELACKVPHIVKARGIVIKTSCNKKDQEVSAPLRLTEDHLVFSESGLKPASELTIGDILFSDLAQEQPCRVVEVTKETEVQTYFGLNCLESIVLANGIKTSTYGKYHVIPSLWMKYASKLVGLDRASSFGDAVADALFKMNLI
jgi:hypothetical protein